MNIIITIIDAPAGYEPHGLLRDMTREASYQAHTLKSIAFTEGGARIDMEPCMHPRPDAQAAGSISGSLSATKAPTQG